MKIRLACLVVAVAFGASSARAAPASYDLKLSDPIFGGSGSLTLLDAPSTTGVTNYSRSQVESLSFLIDGQTFSLSDAKANLSVVQFTNGSLTDITFSDTAGASPNRFALQSSANYVFSYNNEQSVTSGTISATPAQASVSAAPEPGAWALMFAGVAMLGAALRFGRRRQGLLTAAQAF